MRPGTPVQAVDRFGSRTSHTMKGGVTPSATSRHFMRRDLSIRRVIEFGATKRAIF
jgi:hypothetical protein